MSSRTITKQFGTIHKSKKYVAAFHNAVMSSLILKMLLSEEAAIP